MSYFDLAREHSIQSLVDFRAEQTPDGVFFVSPETGKTVTYKDLRAALRAAGGHFAQDVPAGGVVAGLLANGWTAAQLLLAAPYHGRQILMLNAGGGRAALTHALKHSGCRLVFVDDAHLPQLRALAKEEGLDLKIERVCADSGLPGGESPPPPLQAQDDALLIYTSGTTGKPKGVLHTHAGLLYGGAITATAHQLCAADRAFCVLPLCHINAQCVTVFAPLVSGGGVAMPRKFSASNFWRQLAQTQCSWFSVVPTIVSHLLHGDGAPPQTPALRFGRSASSALAPQTHRQFEKRFGAPLIETMGLSETAATILANPMPPAKNKYGSPGVAVGNEVKILHLQTRAPVAANEEGEIAVRGGNVMRGYLHDAQATAAAFAPGGWLLTGDLGRMDEDGFVFVTGRSKELIIRGGENIAPREIDDALYEAEGVVEAAGFGAPCPVYGQRVWAAVVLAEGCNASEAGLIAHCQERVGKFKAPEKIYFLRELPKGPSGKIQRLKLPALVGA